MKNKVSIIHISSNEVIENDNQLTSDFEYIKLPFDYDFQLDKKGIKILVDGKFNSKFNNSIFILDKESNILKNKILLLQLPAHQIIYDHHSMVSSDIAKILLIKEAISFDLSEIKKVFIFIKKQFLVKQLGFKVSNDFIKIQSNFSGSIKKNGNHFTELEGNFGSEFHQIISWRMTNFISENQSMEFNPEIEIISGDVEIYFKIFLIQENTSEISKIIEVSLENILQGERIFFEQPYNCYINVSLYGRKKGKFAIGQMHIRKSLANMDLMIPGGHKISDRDNMSGEVFYYFNSGDLKPPLSIYFSGYRSAEGFEGRRMMANMGGGPYMLIADPRLEGGNFYLGSNYLEKKIIEIILEKLELLGFKNSDLILSGLSMGTFGALYYASDLQPNSVIIGKPLTNIGTIAKNERVLRPDGFPTSLDILLYNTSEVSTRSVNNLNKKFWDKFSKGNYSNTTFAIAYMKQDDYDVEAFPQLFRCLREKGNSRKILYKGFVGRHNDNSNGINQWFLKQYRNIMLSDFGRVISNFE